MLKNRCIFLQKGIKLLLKTNGIYNIKLRGFKQCILDHDDIETSGCYDYDYKIVYIGYMNIDGIDNNGNYWRLWMVLFNGNTIDDIKSCIYKCQGIPMQTQILRIHSKIDGNIQKYDIWLLLHFEPDDAFGDCYNAQIFDNRYHHLLSSPSAATKAIANDTIDIEVNGDMMESLISIVVTK